MQSREVFISTWMTQNKYIEPKYGLKDTEAKEVSNNSTRTWGFGMCQHEIRIAKNQNQVKDSSFMVNIGGWI